MQRYTLMIMFYLFFTNNFDTDLNATPHFQKKKNSQKIPFCIFSPFSLCLIEPFFHSHFIIVVFNNCNKNSHLCIR